MSGYLFQITREKSFDYLLITSMDILWSRLDAKDQYRINLYALCYVLEGSCLISRYEHVLVSFQVQETATEQNSMPAVKRLNVKLTKEKLDTMLGGLGKIRDQLSSVSK